MQSCAACSGAIGEPGKAYGYAGKWCHCVRPIPNDYPHVKGFAEIRLEDLPKSPVQALPLSEPSPMTPTEFVFWLRGYAAHGHIDPKIASQLAKVKP